MRPDIAWARSPNSLKAPPGNIYLGAANSKKHMMGQLCPQLLPLPI